MRCVDCSYRKVCISPEKETACFSSCPLQEHYKLRFKVVANDFGGIGRPSTVTLCEREGIIGNCGLDCPAFDGRVCTQ